MSQINANGHFNSNTVMPLWVVASFEWHCSHTLNKNPFTECKAWRLRKWWLGLVSCCPF